ncbi:MAG: cyclic nucleotide-binding domain-containing protein [Candidatus Pacebacteria bacterium]|jgi:CRP-like cAMP-binding protein|nr:cyclic nucleotide-binding domain-containing protein [Candidatus Paceibacterota bacterium]|tara:strand:+ start:733 stop:1227 length:495 start_codon:yes stop_codon:yes gene_type:complete
MKESNYLAGQEAFLPKIKNLPAFKQCTDEELKGLLRISKIRNFNANEVIINEGSCEKCIYFLLSGYVDIEKDGNVVASLTGLGEVFGEMGFLDENPRTSNVIAVKETICLTVDSTRLLNIKEDGHDSFHAAIYRLFAKILAHRLSVTANKFAESKKLIKRLRRG